MKMQTIPSISLPPSLLRDQGMIEEDISRQRHRQQYQGHEG
jgi:hypothetical protein